MGKTTTCGDGDGDLLLHLLPEYFLIQILACLPVTSLLRFKSVCKSWYSLIQSSFFIDLHTTTTFNNNSSSSKFGIFILQASEPCVDKYGDDIKLFMFSSSSGDDEDDEDDNEDDDDQKKKKMVFKVDDLGFMSFYKDYQLEDTLRMVGSCNGIICLHDSEAMEDSKGITKQHYSNLRDVSLWNPATRQFRILPKSIPIQERKCYVVNWLEDFIAFGFDVKTKDYKVLRITPFNDKSKKGGCMCRVQVYSLSTDSWKLLEGINSLPAVPTQYGIQNHGIYLNGSYLFVGRKFFLGECDSMILSFDFTTEIFTTIQLPDAKKSNVLSYLGGKMVVFTTLKINDYTHSSGYEDFDIWVLNEQHGSVVVNKESWTKLHSFRIKSDCYTEPRCISNNGEFALISISDENWTHMLQLFDLVTKEAKKNFLIDTKVCRADVYKESLVSIMGGGNGNAFLRWHLPTHGTTYKLNLNAPFIDFSCLFGIGLCLTSDIGGCIGVRSLMRGVSDAEKGEALAMLEAIKWAKKLELSPIIIESDSKNCVSFFMDDDDDDNNSTYWSSRAHSLLTEAKLLLNSFELGSISFQYCSRSFNYVADIAAKLGREGGWVCMDWTANPPGEIIRSLSKNLGRESKT